MMVLRQEIARAGLDINNPTKEGILKVIEYLANAETEFKELNTVVSDMKRRIKLVSGIRE